MLWLISSTLYGQLTRPKPVDIYNEVLVSSNLRSLHLRLVISDFVSLQSKIQEALFLILSKSLFSITNCTGCPPCLLVDIVSCCDAKALPCGNFFKFLFTTSTICCCERLRSLGSRNHHIKGSTIDCSATKARSGNAYKHCFFGNRI